MAARRDTTWPIEPHTLTKHEILRRYFQAWLPIMATWAGRILYIDGFAGPGEYSGGEDGSPLIVLRAARDHAHRPQGEVIFIFVEKDEARHAHLVGVVKKIEASLPENFKIYCVHGEFNEELGDVFKQLDEQGRKLAPAFIFVDPFGFSHTPFRTIRRILRDGRCDVLITFMYEEINRFLAHPDHVDTYDDLFGTRGWRSVQGLRDPEERLRSIHDIYLGQLRAVAPFVRSFKMLNRGNRTDYFLFFASSNLLGLEKMKEAMWIVDPGGTFQFSDFTDARGTLTLFSESPDYEALKSTILGRFSQTSVSIEELGDFVVADTPFLRTHIKRQVLRPMEAAGELRVEPAKKGRRRGTFPDGTVLHFN